MIDSILYSLVKYMSNTFIIYEKKYRKYKTKFYELLKKRLKDSIYPTQANDFFFLTIPKGHPNENKEVPVDYLLRNIVLFFWKEGFITLGWNQGMDIITEFKDVITPAFISFDLKLINGKDAISHLKRILEKRFGRDNIFILDESKRKPQKNLIKYLKVLRKKKIDFFFKYPKKIVINIVKEFIAINFRIKFLDWISEKLNIDLPPFEERYPGYLIKYTPPSVDS